MFYRGMGKAELDVAYNNRAVIPDWQDYLNRWTEEGRALYAQATARDLYYGDKPRQRMDLFLTPDKAAPTCLFLHGGYWQWNDKEGQAIVARGPLAHGLNTAIGEYSLAPDATITEICGEAISQVQWLSEELTRRGYAPKILLTGISTGAQLMALALDHPAVIGALLISGIYDLEPIRLSSLNDSIKMDWQEARRFSPLHRVPARTAPVVLSHGSLERPEIVRQTQDYYSVLQSLDRKVELCPVPDTHHFSVLESLSTPGGKLLDCLKRLARRER